MKGTGYKRNADRRALPVYNRLGTSFAPLSVDLRQYSPGVFDQGDSGSCVAHATATAIYIARKFRGDTVIIPSPDLIYKVTRCLERNWGEALTDSGSDPVDAIDAIQRWGVKAMAYPTPDGRFSDVTSEHVNDEPDLASLEWSADWLLLDDYEIKDVGQAKVDAVTNAIAIGNPVRIVVPGGSPAWQNYDPSTILSDNPAAPLDHCVCVVGYAQGYFLVANSWGVSWGDAGYVKVDDSVILRSDECIVTVARSA